MARAGGRVSPGAWGAEESATSSAAHLGGEEARVVLVRVERAQVEVREGRLLRLARRLRLERGQAAQRDLFFVSQSSAPPPPSAAPRTALTAPRNPGCMRSTSSPCSSPSRKLVNASPSARVAVSNTCRPAVAPATAPPPRAGTPAARRRWWNGCRALAALTEGMVAPGFFRPSAPPVEGTAPGRRARPRAGTAIRNLLYGKTSAARNAWPEMACGRLHRPENCRGGAPQGPRDPVVRVDPLEAPPRRRRPAGRAVQAACCEQTMCFITSSLRSDSGGWTGGASTARLGEGGRNSRHQGGLGRRMGPETWRSPDLCPPRAPLAPLVAPSGITPER